MNRFPLRLSATPSEKWRENSGGAGINSSSWRKTRAEILERDHHTCVFCGFSSPKYMEVHHIGGESTDDSERNLLTCCPLCHGCLHVGFLGVSNKGALVSGCDLSQEEINRGCLEAGASSGIVGAKAFVKSVRFKDSAGHTGLIMLANDLISMKIRVAPAHMRFLPRPESFLIFEYLDREFCRTSQQIGSSF